MPSAKTESEQTHDKDYVAIAKAYAKKALDKKNRKRFGIWIRLAAQRFLDDLARSNKKGAPFRFDEWHANDVCDFAEKLTVQTQGDMDGFLKSGIKAGR